MAAHSKPPSPRRTALAGLVVLLFAQGAAAQTSSDYGDAPAPYPTKRAVGGVHHLDTTKEWIGFSAASTTTREADALRADFDDGAPTFLSRTVPGVQTINLFFINVSYDRSRSSPHEARYLNVLVDLDDDGSWEGGKEWPIRNVRIPFEDLPSTDGRLRLLVAIDASIEITDFLGRKWCRATISTERVSDGSGRWGQLARGETEDFVSGFQLALPRKLTTFPIPRFVPAAPVIHHGHVHALDIEPNPPLVDAHVEVAFPPSAVGKPVVLKIWWKRRSDANGNPYIGNIIAGAASIVPLPDRLNVWSPVPATRAYAALKAIDRVQQIPIHGSFLNHRAYGDTHVRFKARMTWDPQGEYASLLFDDGVAHSVHGGSEPHFPGSFSNSAGAGYCRISESGCTGEEESLVVPRSASAAYGNSLTQMPFASVPMRFQQVLLGSELFSRAAAITALSLRRDQTARGRRGEVVDVEIRMGETSRGLFNLSSGFDRNYTGTPTTVLSRRALRLPDMPETAIRSPSEFLVRLVLDRPFYWVPAPGRNMLVEVFQHGNSARSRAFAYDLDAVNLGNSACVLGSIEASEGEVSRYGCLVMKLEAPSTPQLRHSQPPRVGGSFGVDVLAGPGAAAVLLLGPPADIDMSVFGAKGCTLRVGPVALPVLGVTNRLGLLAGRLPVPNDGRLGGGILHSQVLVLDAKASPSGILVTPGSQCTIGAR